MAALGRKRPCLAPASKRYYWAVTSCANAERIEQDQALRSIPNRHQLL